MVAIKFSLTVFRNGWVGILAGWKQDPNILVNLPATKALCNLDQEFGIHRYLSINIIICICLSILGIKSLYLSKPIIFLAIHPYYIYVSVYSIYQFCNIYDCVT